MSCGSTSESNGHVTTMTFVAECADVAREAYNVKRGVIHRLPLPELDLELR